MAVRVAGGSVKGARLRSVRGMALRPTSAKVREAVFDILGGRIRGTRFGDFFAGAGAVGIEALSRGASHVVFVERHPRSLKLIRQNLTACGLLEQATIIPMDALTYLRTSRSPHPSARPGPLQILFADPPYQGSTVHDFLRLAQARNIIAEDGLMVIEHFHKQDLPEQAGSLRRVKIYRYGDTSLSVYTPDAAAQERS